MIDESNFDRYKAIAYRTARKTLPEHKAEDVASETLVRLWRSSTPVENEVAWIKETAGWLALDEKKQLQCTTSIDGVDDDARDRFEEALLEGAVDLVGGVGQKTTEDVRVEATADIDPRPLVAQSEVTRYHAELEPYGGRYGKSRVFLREVSGKESVVTLYMDGCAKAKEFVKNTRPADARGAKYRALVDWLAWDMGDNLTVTEGPTRVDVRELAPPRREPQEGEASILYRDCTNETEARDYRERAEARAGHRLRPKPDYDNIRPLPKWANPGPTSEAEIAQRWKVGSAADLQLLGKRFQDYARTH